jgi:hypothetical protein
MDTRNSLPYPAKRPQKDAIEELLDNLGGEKLEGSAFENETPEPGFRESYAAEAE